MAGTGGREVSSLGIEARVGKGSLLNSLGMGNQDWKRDRHKGHHRWVATGVLRWWGTPREN